MKNLKYILLLLLILEIAAFALVGKYLGVGVTVLLVIVTSAFGLWLQKRSGFAAIMKAAQNMQTGGAMPKKMPNGFHAFSALLLIIPGFLTDILGLLLLLPFMQKKVGKLAMKLGGGMMGGMPPMGGFRPPAQNDNVIEGEVDHSKDHLDNDGR